MILLSSAILFVRQVPYVVGILRTSKVTYELMVARVLRAPMSFFDTTPTGRIINRFSKDVEAMDIGIPESLNFLYKMVFVIVGIFGIMCYSAPYLSILIVGLLAVYGVFLPYYTATNRAVKRLQDVTRSPVVSIMNETLGGLPTIRAYDMGAHFHASHNQRFVASLIPTYSWTVASRWMAFRVDLISSSVTLGVSLLAVLLLSQYYDQADRQAQLPVIALAIMYGIAVSTSFSFLAMQSAELESMMSSLERVHEYIFDVAQEREVEYGLANMAPEPSWPRAGRVSFERASMRYREGLDLVLKEVSFTAEPGQKVGLVGRTGSGKSSMLLALFRMVELAAGRIEIDGRDAATLRLRDLRSAITIISQDPVMFRGTLRSNLDPFFKHEAGDVWAVLQRVGMAERVRKDVPEALLAEGVSEAWLQASVAERGANFSVG